MNLEKELKAGEKKGLFHSEGSSFVFKKFDNQLKGLSKKQGKPALWKRALIKGILFFANMMMRLFGSDPKANNITVEEVEIQKHSEDEEILVKVKEAVEILQKQSQRRRRGAILRPKKKLYTPNKKGILDYGKFVNKAGQEIKPIIKL